MTKPRRDLDPSVAFTVLLDVLPGFADSPDDGGKTVKRFLAAWYDDPGLDMHAFGRQWAARRTAPYCPNTDGHHVHDYDAGKRLDRCSVCGWTRQCGLYAGGCTIGYLPLHHAPEVDA